MEEEAIGEQIVDAALKVHRALGPGLLESVYEAAMAVELRSRGLTVETQVPIDVVYEGVPLGLGFRIDLLVNGLVLVELKSVEEINSKFRKQTTTYLRLANLRLGFLINFNVPLIKDGLVRIVNELRSSRYDSSSRPSRASRDTFLR